MPPLPPSAPPNANQDLPVAVPAPHHSSTTSSDGGSTVVGSETEKESFSERKIGVTELLLGDIDVSVLYGYEDDPRYHQSASESIVIIQSGEGGRERRAIYHPERYRRRRAERERRVLEGRKNMMEEIDRSSFPSSCETLASQVAKELEEGRMSSSCPLQDRSPTQARNREVENKGMVVITRVKCSSFSDEEEEKNHQHLSCSYPATDADVSDNGRRHRDSLGEKTTKRLESNAQQDHEEAKETEPEEETRDGKESSLSVYKPNLFSVPIAACTPSYLEHLRHELAEMRRFWVSDLHHRDWRQIFVASYYYTKVLTPSRVVAIRLVLCCLLLLLEGFASADVYRDLGLPMFLYFTNWNSYLISLYFLLLCIISVRALCSFRSPGHGQSPEKEEEESEEAHDLHRTQIEEEDGPGKKASSRGKEEETEDSATQDCPNKKKTRKGSSRDNEEKEDEEEDEDDDDEERKNSHAPSTTSTTTTTGISPSPAPCSSSSLSSSPSSESHPESPNDLRDDHLRPSESRATSSSSSSLTSPSSPRAPPSCLPAPAPSAFLSSGRKATLRLTPSRIGGTSRLSCEQPRASSLFPGFSWRRKQRTPASSPASRAEQKVQIVSDSTAVDRFSEDKPRSRGEGKTSSRSWSLKSGSECFPRKKSSTIGRNPEHRRHCLPGYDDLLSRENLFCVDGILLAPNPSNRGLYDSVLDPQQYFCCCSNKQQNKEEEEKKKKKKKNYREKKSAARTLDHVSAFSLSPSPGSTPSSSSSHLSQTPPFSCSSSASLCPPRTPLLISIAWILHSIQLIASVGVFLIFFSLLEQNGNTFPEAWYSVWKHLAIVLITLCHSLFLSRIPIPLKHIVFAYIFIMIYLAVQTAVYFLNLPNGDGGYGYVYRVFDMKYPLRALGVSSMVLLSISILILILWSLTRHRNLLVSPPPSVSISAYDYLLRKHRKDIEQGQRQQSDGRENSDLGPTHDDFLASANFSIHVRNEDENTNKNKIHGK